MLVRMICNFDGFEINKKYDLSEGQLECMKGSYIITGKKAKAKPPYTKRHYNRVLFVKGHGIGNAINITPSIIAFREHEANTLIDVFCLEQNTDVFEGWPIINKIYTEKNEPTDKYDLIFIGAPADIPTQKILQHVKADRVIQANHGDLRQKHEVEVNHAMLAKIGIQNFWRQPPNTMIFIDDEIKTEIGKQFKDKKLIAICPGWSRINNNFWQRKDYGKERYVELMNQLTRKFKDYHFVIIGGEEDFLKIWGDHIIHAEGAYCIKESAEILRLCDFAIANDTGAAHMATAVGTFVYSIFGPTLPAKNRPWGNGEIITGAIKCQPCQYTPQWNECSDYKCMEIKPAEIVKQIVEREDQREYEIGILIGTYERYDNLITTLYSLYQCYDFKNMKIVVSDDCSQNPKIDIALQEFQELIKEQDISLKIIKSPVHHGKEKYCKVLEAGFRELKNCEYVIFIPDDALFNPWIFQAARYCLKYFDNEIKCIQFFQDNYSYLKKIHKEPGLLPLELDKYFYYTQYQDGFFCIYERKAIENFVFRNTAKTTSSRFWGQWRDQFFGEYKYKTLCLRESLCEHIGNLKSEMNPEERQRAAIYSVNTNIFKKPKLLEDDGVLG